MNIYRDKWVISHITRELSEMAIFYFVPQKFSGHLNPGHLITNVRITYYTCNSVTKSAMNLHNYLIGVNKNT